jgi:hypothetical protein
MDPWLIPITPSSSETNSLSTPMDPWQNPTSPTPLMDQPIPSPHDLSTDPEGEAPQAGRVSNQSLLKYVRTYNQSPAPAQQTLNTWEGLRDLIDTLEDMPLEQQCRAVETMTLTISIISPHLLDVFLERLKTSPVSAQTNTLADESLRFSGYNDRKELLSDRPNLRRTYQDPKSIFEPAPKGTEWGTTQWENTVT